MFMSIQFSLRGLIMTFCSAFLCLQSLSVVAQSKSESELIQRVVACLQHKDSFAYAQVFPSADTLTQVTLRKAPKTSDEYQRASYLAESPAMLQFQDSASINENCEVFRNILMKGEKLGIHWADILMNRYELEAMPHSRDTISEAIAPERFLGYLFIEDMLTRKFYTISISDVKKMDRNWYGGSFSNIFEGASKDDFNSKLKAEKLRIMRGLPDTLMNQSDSNIVRNEDEEDTKPYKRKQVVARKYYSGYLDNEIQVSIYIRSIKGDCPTGVCSWEAIFKFGDNDYSKQEVSRTEDGKWLFVEDETGGVMELELKGDTFVGTFSATLDKVDYDAQLKERPMGEKKLEALDSIIEKDLTR